MILNLSGNQFSGSQEETDTNTERREKRVERENLLREYAGQIDEITRSLADKEKNLAEIETKVRFGKEMIDGERQELISLEGKMANLRKMIGRDAFELNQNKVRSLALGKEIAGLKNNLAIAQKKWKKIRNG